MLSTDLALAITADREREMGAAIRLNALLAAPPRRDRPFGPLQPILRLARLPIARLAAAWSR